MTDYEFFAATIQKSANSNLRRFHAAITLFLKKSVLFPTKGHYKQSYYSEDDIEYDKVYSRDYYSELINNLCESPIHQCYIMNQHWIRFMTELGWHAKKQRDKINNDKVNDNNAYFFSLLNRNLNSIHAEWWTTNELNTRLFSVPGSMKSNFYNHVRQNKSLYKWWPYKPATATQTKSNLHLNDCLLSLKKYDNKYYSMIVKQLHKTIGLSNDQLTSIIFSHFLLCQKGHYYDFYCFTCLVMDIDLCAGLCDFIKMVGVAHNDYMSSYAELECLYGRGAMKLDLMDDVTKTCGTKDVDGYGIEFDDDVIYNEAIKLFERSMPSVLYSDETCRWNNISTKLDDYWANRNINCVNGAHHLPTGCELSTDKQYIKKHTRMTWLESMKFNPMYKTTPIIEASLSIKYENPKMRPIKGQDTLSYLNEDYIQKIVEKLWTNPEVLLDPSLPTKGAEARRIDDMVGDEYVMLDYKKMDAQHSLKSQIELKKALFKFLCVPDEYSNWLLEAEGNQYIRYKDMRFKVRRSMLTGRRSTSFINSCLNWIYLEIALQKTKTLIKSRYHAGDDIILRCNNRDDARLVINEALKSRSIFNPKKISWGLSGEFLRHSVFGKASFGYANRSIASFVCGSWVNDIKLAGGDIPSLFYRYAWTIDNRSNLTNSARYVMTYAMHVQSKYSLNTCWAVCGHEICVHGGPTTCNDFSLTVMKPYTETVEQNIDKSKLPSYASNDYISTQANKLNLALDQKQIGQLRNTFRNASYKKGLTVGFKTIKTDYLYYNVIPGVSNIDYHWVDDVIKGIVELHPTLPSIRNMLRRNDFELIAYVLTGKRMKAGLDLETWLWGSKSGCLVCPVNNNFDDLSQIAKHPIYKNIRWVPKIHLPRCVHY